MCEIYHTSKHLRVCGCMHVRSHISPEKACVIQLNMSKAPPLFAPVCRYNIPEFKPDVVEQGKEKEFHFDPFSNCF